MESLERADVRVLRSHDFLGEPQAARQIVEFVHRTVVLQFVRVAGRHQEQHDQATLDRSCHLR